VIDEPEMTESMKALKREAETRAKRRGHELGEWKWDGHGAWRSWCQHRNCYASAWLSPNEPNQSYGGSAIFGT